MLFTFSAVKCQQLENKVKFRDSLFLLVEDTTKIMNFRTYHLNLKSCGLIHTLLSS